MTNLGKETRFQINMIYVLNYLSPSKKRKCDAISSAFDQVEMVLNISLQRIEDSSPGARFLSLTAIKESINLLNRILRSIYSGLSHFKSATDEYNVLKSLLFSFYEVDLSNILQRIIKFPIQLQKKKKGKGKEEEVYDAPKVILSVDTLVNLYLLIGVLVNIPPIFIGYPSQFGYYSIINFVKNPYKQIFDATYDWNLFNEEINLKFYHFSVWNTIIVTNSVLT